MKRLLPATTWMLVIFATASAPSLAGSSKITVRGRVVDSAGDPIDGARIYVFVPLSNQILITGTRILPWNEVGGSVEPLFELYHERLAGLTISAPLGRFEVADLPPLWDGRVCIYHPAYLPRIVRQKQWTIRDGVVDLGDVVLGRGGEVRGTVRAPGGPAVPGAILGIQKVEPKGGGTDRPRIPGFDRKMPETLHSPRPRVLGDIRSVRADGEGKYRFTGLVAGRYVVAAWSHSRPVVERVVHVIPENEPLVLDFELPPGEALTVRVTYTHDGKPFPGAIVRIRRWKDRGGRWSWENEEPLTASAETGPDGKVVFTALAPGKYLVQALPPDRRNDTRRTPVGFSVQARFETGTEAHLQLEPLAPIHGKALNDETGLMIPLFDATLRAVWRKDSPNKASRNRADLDRRDVWTGKFRFEDARPGPWKLEIRAQGYFPTVVEMDLPVGGMPEPILVRVKPGKGRMSGLVVDDETGRPLKSVKVVLNEQFSRSMWGNRAETWTNPDGKFTLKRLLGMSDHPRIYFMKSGYVTKEVKLDGTKPHPEVFETVRLKKTGAIRGILVNAAGEPIEGGAIWARPVRGSAKGYPEVRTGPDGRFVVENLAPGHYLVTGHRGAVEVKAGETVEIRCVKKPRKRR